MTKTTHPNRRPMTRIESAIVGAVVSATVIGGVAVIGMAIDSLPAPAQPVSHSETATDWDTADDGMIRNLPRCSDIDLDYGDACQLGPDPATDDDLLTTATLACPAGQDTVTAEREADGFWYVYCDG